LVLETTGFPFHIYKNDKNASGDAKRHGKKKGNQPANQQHGKKQANQPANQHGKKHANQHADQQHGKKHANQHEHKAGANDPAALPKEFVKDPTKQNEQIKHYIPIVLKGEKHPVHQNSFKAFKKEFLGKHFPIFFQFQ